jgi:transcription factor C subunit 7
METAGREGWRAIIICTYVAAMIAIGRVLSGRMPEDAEEEDFQCFPAFLSQHNRIALSLEDGDSVPTWSPEVPELIARIYWQGNGIKGGWTSLLNGDCSFLAGGEERGWTFSGDEKCLRDSNAFNDTRGCGEIRRERKGRRWKRKSINVIRSSMKQDK